MRRQLMVMILLLAGIILYAQTGIGTENPDPTAILEVKSVEKGFLPPRMTTTQRDAINGGNPTGGLIIYNTDANCLQYWNTTKWVSFCEENNNSGSFTYWVDDTNVEDDAKYLYVENGTDEDFSGNLFVYHEIWYFPYATVPYTIEGTNGSSAVINGEHIAIYNLGTISLAAGQTIRLKIELKTQTTQPMWEPTGSATIPVTDELKLSRSVVLGTDEDPVQTTLPIVLTSYVPN